MVSTQIRSRRLARELTQCQLADLVGVGQPSIVGWEHGDVDVSYVARWNGRTWNTVHVPSATVGHTTSGQHEGEELLSVGAGAPGNAWAVGFSVSSGFTGWYTLHWNGHAWQVGRDPGGAAFRSAWKSYAGDEISTAATKQGDVWLVADEDAIARNRLGKWSPVPNAIRDVDLHAVSAVGRGQAWAVGDRGAASSSGSAFTPVIEHVDCPS